MLNETTLYFITNDNHVKSLNRQIKDMLYKDTQNNVFQINLATQMGLDFNECLEHAYNEIKDRKGKTVNGVFIKEADLKNGKDNQ